MLGIFVYVFHAIDRYLFHRKQTTSLKIKDLSMAAQKNKWFKKIERLLHYLSYTELKLIGYFKPILIVVASITFSILTYFVTYSYLEVSSAAFILSMYSFFVPYFILSYLYNNFRKKIISTFPTYLISLKNYTQISNDILVAMRKVKVDKPLSIFIHKFNLLIEKGVNVYDAFEILKYEIDMKKISQFITAVQNCYLNGGNFTKLLERYAKMMNRMNLQSEKEKQENFSSILVLVILIVINVFLIVSFIYTNQQYKIAITTNLVGKLLLDLNFLSYFAVFYFIKKIYKMEE